MSVGTLEEGRRMAELLLERLAAEVPSTKLVKNVMKFICVIFKIQLIKKLIYFLSITFRTFSPFPSR